VSCCVAAIATRPGATSHALSKRSGAEPICRRRWILYAPLANRLGIWQLKWELEDLSFPLPRTRDLQVGCALHCSMKKRSERESFIVRSTGRLRTLVAEAGLRRRDQRPAQAHLQHLEQDAHPRATPSSSLRARARGLRVIVDEVPQCYQVLALVHSAWTHGGIRIR